uniref:Right handed beta helix domain-containing protein n=1 Tax=Amphimedon queenslandica TaxID=400682 RepID=A0A1X7U9X8_AMPQE
KGIMAAIFSLLLFSVLFSRSLSVLVSNDCSQFDTNMTGDYCMNVSEALSSIASDTLLIFEPGIHSLAEPVTIASIENIKLFSSSYLPTTIHCSSSVGIVFHNITSLYIEGLSFSRCRVDPSQLEYISDELGPRLELNITGGIGIGLIISSTIDTTLNRVTVRDTSGLGLLGVNMMGVVYIVNSYFINNTSPSCYQYVMSLSNPGPELVGGGATLYYHDNEVYESAWVHVVRSHFHGNQGCNTNALIRFFPTVEPVGFRPGEGGLHLLVAQYQVPHSIKTSFLVDSCSFVSNRGTFGSGLTIFTFSTARNALFEIHKCLFIDNGHVPSPIGADDQFVVLGGGMAIGLDFLRLKELAGDFNQYNLIGRNVSILIEDSTFYNNSAFFGGAISLYSFKLSESLHQEDVSLIIISSCWLHSNTGTIGGAAYFAELKTHGSNIGTLVVFEDTLVTMTTLITNLDDNVAYSSGAIDMEKLHILTKNLTITDSRDGSGLVLDQSLLTIKEGGLFLICNSGIYGGGLQLLDYSSVIFSDQSSIFIINNSAVILGGGLYVNHAGFNPGIVYDDCFISLLLNFSFIEITGNTAPLGNVLYGSALRNCPWADEAALESNITSYNNTFQLLQLLYPDKILVINTNPLFSINTASESLLLLSGNSVSGIPGQTVYLDMIALDKLDRPLSVPITSNQTSGGAKLGTSGYWFLDGNTVVPLTLHGKENDVFGLKIFTTDSFVNQVVSIALGQCVPGFEYDSDSYSCVCIHELEEFGITCNITELSVIVPHGKWFGLLDRDLNPTLDNLVVSDCDRYPCFTSLTQKVINGSYSDQCQEDANKEGLVCGQCKEGYSLTIAGSKCQLCSNWWIIFVVPFFLLSGLLFSVVLVYFRITITGGYINGFIFYENVASLYTYKIFPTLSYIYPFQTSLFTCGLELCFFDGFNLTHRTFFYLLYPLYLFILMGVTYIAAKRIKYLSKYGTEISKAFVTLIVICYVQLTEISVSIMTPIWITSLSSVDRFHWKFDPTVQYFSGAHSVLVVIAVLILIFYTLTVPLILVHPPLLYKRFNYFKPLFDAFWYPFKPKFRFWLSVKLLIRLLFFLTAKFIPNPIDLFLLILFLFFFLIIEINVQPFKGRWRNRVNSYFTVNLTVLLLVTQYFTNTTKNSSGTAPVLQTIIAGTLVALAYSALIPIGLYHLSFKWPKIRNIRKLRNIRNILSLSSIKKWWNEKREKSGQPLETDARSTVTELSAIPPLTPALPRMADLSRYRESVFNLMDESENTSESRDKKKKKK